MGVKANFDKATAEFVLEQAEAYAKEAKGQEAKGTSRNTVSVPNYLAKATSTIGARSGTTLGTGTVQTYRLSYGTGTTTAVETDMDDLNVVHFHTSPISSGKWVRIFRDPYSGKWIAEQLEC